MVGGVGYRDGKRGTKAYAVLCSLDPDSVVTIAVHAHNLRLNVTLVNFISLRPVSDRTSAVSKSRSNPVAALSILRNHSAAVHGSSIAAIRIVAASIKRLAFGIPG
jgi:hypothetical protein